MQKLNIQKFKIEDTVNNAHYAIIGMRGSGKSWIVRSIIENLWLNKRIDSCIIFSPTNKMSSFYEDFLNEDNIYFECKTEIIQKILDNQKELGEEKKNICVVFDDCLSSKCDWIKDNTFIEFFSNARNYNITFIYTMQFPLGFTLEFRNNFDYILALNDQTISNQKRIYEHYANFISSFDIFRKIFTQLTHNYNSICICNKENKFNFFCAKRKRDDFFIDNIYLEKEIEVKYPISDMTISDMTVDDLESNCSSNSSSNSSYNFFSKLNKKYESMNMINNIIGINKKITEVNEKIIDFLLSSNKN